MLFLADTRLLPVLSLPRCVEASKEVGTPPGQRPPMCSATAVVALPCLGTACASGGSCAAPQQDLRARTWPAPPPPELGPWAQNDKTGGNERRAQSDCKCNRNCAKVTPSTRRRCGPSDCLAATPPPGRKGGTRPMVAREARPPMTPDVPSCGLGRSFASTVRPCRSTRAGSGCAYGCGRGGRACHHRAHAQSRPGPLRPPRSSDN